MNAELIIDAVAPADELIFIGGCRQYKPNCQTGQFMIRDSAIGPKLLMEVIGAKVIEAELFDYPFQKWIVVVFADSSRTVSQILFKTESLDNFIELYRKVATEKPFGSVRIQAVMSKRSGMIKDDKGEAKPTNYFAVEFEVAGNAVFYQEALRFRKQHFTPELYLVRSEKAVLLPPVVNTETGEILNSSSS